MFIRTALVVLLPLTASAQNLSTNLALSGAHSAQASSHGSAAAGQIVSTIIATPIIVTGAALSVSGAAIQSAGNGSLALGTDMIRTSNGQTTATPIRPNAAPTLD